MRERLRALGAALLLFGAGAATAEPSRTLSFAERVAALEAIQRVYYSHQIGTTRPFAEAVPRSVLEDKVRTYLQQSVALERIWRTSITAEALDQELDRIARSTRLPARLQEIYTALDGDPFLVRECLARPVLVDRLARRFFAADDAIHADARVEADRLRERLLHSDIPLDADHPLREATRIELIGTTDSTPDPVEPRVPASPSVHTLPPEAFARERARLPRGAGDIGEVRELPLEFTVAVVLGEDDRSVMVATYSVPKRTWDDWWAERRDDLDEGSVAAVSSRKSLPTPGLRADSGGDFRSAPIRLSSAGEAAASSCLPDDTWDTTGLDDATMPDERSGHTAVWTGTQMVVWGGSGIQNYRLNTGGRYDPLTDTWAHTSTTNAPSARNLHTAVWTGSSMLIWGGADGAEANTGGRYDPVADIWLPISLAGAPSGRYSHTAVWTGTRMVVWGGAGQLNTGGRYDPSTDTWLPTTTWDAPPGRSRHTAVWTGSRMLVWGGFQATGGRYDPSTDAWTLITALNAPSTRDGNTAIWTGSEMLVWGGSGGPYTVLNTGGKYNPATDTWAPTSIVQAPAAREGHVAVWTGTRMIVWAGSSSLTGYNTGGIYAPATDSWTPTSTLNAPIAVTQTSAVWTGSLMVAWGGSDYVATRVDTGGRYDPQTDTWTPTFSTFTPQPRARHASVWTGTQMIVWGGDVGYQGQGLGGGGRYDPLTSAWTPTTLVNAPTRRTMPSAVWTGREMVIWGGLGTSNYPDGWRGGRYDPLTDSWSPTSIQGAPEGRYLHSAVWTGREMIVWGGFPVTQGGCCGNDGGRYDPVLDRWTRTAMAGAPDDRREHAAVWTGREMIVWGGDDGSRGCNTGGRYDPATDSWTPTSVVGAPSGRTYHAGVWSGTELIVWGGSRYGAHTATGGRYDPRLDLWRPTSLVAAPEARDFHTAVWTGRQMIVWGGHASSEAYLNTGARYEPALDTWTPISTVDAPSARVYHTAVWAGNPMVVWGGQESWYGDSLSTGGSYSFGDFQDDDRDGVTICAGDCDDSIATCIADCTDADGDAVPACGECDDADPRRFPGNPEICDAFDNDCDEIVDGFTTHCGVGGCARTGTCMDGGDDCVVGDPGWEECDGVDNDCDGALPTDEADRDRDGAYLCTPDCHDGIAAIHPGASEVNDGLDNECSGDPGFGLVDEISGSAGFLDPAAPGEFCWPAQAGATRYEVSRSPVPNLATGCLRAATTAPCWADPEDPPAGGVFYYLVQAIAPQTGSLGRASSGQERSAVCGRENDCDDGRDDDADGSTDCADAADCYGRSVCATATYRFVDTYGDDTGTSSLVEFFAGMEVGADDHMLISLAGLPPADFEICLARVDFYRDSYVALSATVGIVPSGTWDKWYRIGGGEWVGPLSEPFENWYGDDCVGPFSWCPEVGLGGRILGVSPWELGICEAFEYISCSDGTWEFTLRVGTDRGAACGF